MSVIDEMVNRFLSWPLPTSVRPDQCAMDQTYPHRIGTNLLTADEARAMLQHVVGDALSESVIRETYEAAVKGRADFREALRESTAYAVSLQSAALEAWYDWRDGMDEDATVASGHWGLTLERLLTHECTICEGSGDADGGGHCGTCVGFGRVPKTSHEIGTGSNDQRRPAAIQQGGNGVLLSDSSGPRGSDAKSEAPSEGVSGATNPRHAVGTIPDDKLREVARQHALDAVAPIGSRHSRSDMVVMQNVIRQEEIIFYAMKDAQGLHSQDFRMGAAVGHPQPNSDDLMAAWSALPADKRFTDSQGTPIYSFLVYYEAGRRLQLREYAQCNPQEP